MSALCSEHARTQSLMWRHHCLFPQGHTALRNKNCHPLFQNTKHKLSFNEKIIHIYFGQTFSWKENTYLSGLAPLCCPLFPSLASEANFSEMGKGAKMQMQFNHHIVPTENGGALAEDRAISHLSGMQFVRLPQVHGVVVCQVRGWPPPTQDGSLRQRGWPWLGRLQAQLQPQGQRLRWLLQLALSGKRIPW